MSSPIELCEVCNISSTPILMSGMCRSCNDKHVKTQEKKWGNEWINLMKQDQIDFNPVQASSKKRRF